MRLLSQLSDGVIISNKHIMNGFTCRPHYVDVPIQLSVVGELVDALAGCPSPPGPHAAVQTHPDVHHHHYGQVGAINNNGSVPVYVCVF